MLRIDVDLDYRILKLRSLPTRAGAELIRVARHEVGRQKAPLCRADIDEKGGYIYLREHAS